MKKYKKTRWPVDQRSVVAYDVSLSGGLRDLYLIGEPETELREFIEEVRVLANGSREFDIDVKDFFELVDKGFVLGQASGRIMRIPLDANYAESENLQRLTIEIKAKTRYSLTFVEIFA